MGNKYRKPIDSPKLYYKLGKSPAFSAIEKHSGSGNSGNMSPMQLCIRLSILQRTCTPNKALLKNSGKWRTRPVLQISKRLRRVRSLLRFRQVIDLPCSIRYSKVHQVTETLRPAV